MFAYETPVSEFVQLCHGVVVSEISSFYTHIILPPHFTNNFSLHTTRSSHTIFWLRHRHRNRQNNPGWVLFQSTDCGIISSIFFTRV